MLPTYPVNAYAYISIISAMSAAHSRCSWDRGGGGGGEGRV